MDIRLSFPVDYNIAKKIEYYNIYTIVTFVALLLGDYDEKIILYSFNNNLTVLTKSLDDKLLFLTSTRT